VSAEEGRDKVNSMVRLTGIPVNILPRSGA
jgi:hypothetical protein